MAITLTYTIGGDIQEEGTPARRLKDAIDYRAGDENGEGRPTTMAEYKDYVDGLLTRALVSYVRRAEQAKLEEERAAILDLEITIN